MIKVKLISADEALERYVTHLLELGNIQVQKRPEPEPSLLILLEPTRSERTALEQEIYSLDTRLPVLCIGTKRSGAGLSRFDRVSYLKRPFQVEKFYEHLENLLDRSLPLNLEERQNPFLGEDEKVADLRRKIPFLAEVPNPILLEGEPGTGKEHFARHIHARIGGPLVKFAARALPEEMQEALLFGFAPGTFPKVKKGKDGALEKARNGVLYLEGLESLSPTCQQKLLYFLETGSFFPVGSREALSPTVKLIVSVSQSPGDLLKSGRLLPSLYFRLAEFSVYLPPLRRRFIDLPLLVEHFLEIYTLLYRQPYQRPSQELLERFLLYQWPRNISELELIVKDFVIFGEEKIREEIVVRREKEVFRLRQLEEELDQRFEELFHKKEVKVQQIESTRRGRGGPRTGSR